MISSGTRAILMVRGTDLARLDERRDMLANVDAEGTPVGTASFMGGHGAARQLRTRRLPRALARDIGRCALMI